METALVIGFVGAVAALVAALVVMRRRADQVEALEDRLRAASEPDVDKRPTLPGDDVDDLLPVGVLRFDPAGRIVAANARAHALLDVVPGRLLGRSIMETFLDARVEGALASLAAGASAVTEIRARDGDQRTVLVRARRAPGGALDVVLEDVTELRRLQQIRTEFIDNLSHELRTPLSTVSLLAETLARDAERADVPARMRERIAKVEVETGHLVQMVNELLDLARIEGGSQLRLEDEVDLGRLAESSAERLRLFADRQGVTIAVDVEPDLPLVRGDEARLGQVFVNLVHNAVKFSPDGGEVRIGVRQEGDEVVVSVRDHGIGIAKADRTRVFERFYKTDRARVRGGGTGLGLSIARHVVRGHGGRIGVESEEGEGSTFTFTIPLRAPEGVPGTAPEPTTAA
ncbi:MAG TPA: ATP-binding protein [Candidatus Limnocylindrales bacterium]|nr:ATP-binding protein [Candidatus Limnocylindrales bacterium]